MPARPKSEPLTPAQLSAIYNAYTHPTTILPVQPTSDAPHAGLPTTNRVTIAYLARIYKVSPSVIHRAIHTEAYRCSLDTPLPS